MSLKRANLEDIFIELTESTAEEDTSAANSPTDTSEESEVANQ